MSKFLPSISFLVQNLETSSTHSFLSSSLTPSPSFPAPVSLPFFLPSYYLSPSLPLSIHSTNSPIPSSPSLLLPPSPSLPSSLYSQVHCGDS